MKTPTLEERQAALREYAYGKTDKVGDEAVIDNAHRLIVALQIALGDDTDDVPTWDNLRDRLVGKVRALEVEQTLLNTGVAVAKKHGGIYRLTAQDGAIVSNEKLAELQSKAAKWDQHKCEARFVGPGISPEPAEVCVGKNGICANHEFKHGACVSCGKRSPNPIEHVRGRLMDVFIDDGAEWKPDLWKRENGEGIKAQGGEYTEPGNVKVYCDNGSDE